jgi:hypothetical protein
MAKWFVTLSEEKKTYFILVAIAILGFAFLSPLFFFRLGSWPLGWLFGSVIEIICYFTIVRFSDTIFAEKSKTSAVVVAVALNCLRIFLYLAGLFLGAICTFRSEWFGGWNAINFWAVFLSYMPLQVVLIVRSLLQLRAEKNAAKIEK